MHMTGAEGQRLANDGRRTGCGVQLMTNGQIPGQQAKTDRDAVGIQAVADEVVEVMPVAQFVDGLLDPSSPAGRPESLSSSYHSRSASPIGTR